MSLTKDLRVWREERNINSNNTHNYIANIVEELLEIVHDDKRTIKYIQAKIMSEYFADIEPISELNTIDAMQDIQVFSINETELMGYNNELCNKEVFSHINARRQDPMQKSRWKAGDKLDGEKWVKDSAQTDIYEPMYDTCELNK